MSLRFSKLLYPTDFSECALGALTYVRGLAETFGAELHCVHVVDTSAQYWSTTGPESLPVGAIPDEALELAAKRLADFVRQHLAGSPTPPHTEVLAGQPSAEIVDYAEAHGIDLIVMATHGRGPLSHVLMGSTTEGVMRKAHCPVLTVRHAGGRDCAAGGDDA